MFPSKPLKVKYRHSKLTSTKKSWKKHIFYLYPSLSNYITTNFQPPKTLQPSPISNNPSLPPSLAIALPIPKLLGSSKVLRSTSHTVSLSSSWRLVSRFHRVFPTGRFDGGPQRFETTGPPPSAAKSSRPKAWRWSFTRSFWDQFLHNGETSKKVSKWFQIFGILFWDQFLGSILLTISKWFQEDVLQKGDTSWVGKVLFEPDGLFNSWIMFYLPEYM